MRDHRATSRIARRYRQVSAALVVCALLVLTGCSSSNKSGSAGSAGSGPKLSMDTITFGGVQEANAMFAFFAAQAKGFYKQQGLTVDFKETTASGADIAAAVAAGAYRIAVVASQATVLAEDKGAPIRPFMGNGYGGVDQLAIRTSVATAKHIPSSGLPAQLAALKGSHLQIGISNKTSGSFINLMAVLKQNGINYDGPNADVTFQTLGSPTTLATALKVGKVESIANNPPTTTQPDTIAIDFGQGPPVGDVVQWMVATAPSMMSAHADTVQAFANATVQGWDYVRKHPDEAYALAQPYFKAAGITDDATVQLLVKAQLGLITASNSSPAITSAGFAALTQILANAGQPLKGSYSTLVDNTFVNKAMTQLNVDAPKGS